MKNLKKITVNLKERSYGIYIANNQFNCLGRLLKESNIGNHAVIISNSKIKKLYNEKIVKTLSKSSIKNDFIEVPDSEKAKSVSCLSKVISKIARIDVRKRIFVIALGGGVIGDLSGFAAAVYKRGIPYVQVPTSLLAQVDSSIGGKVAVDLQYGKNLLGAFYQPRLVFSDVSTVSSLNLRQLKTGLAEVIKYGVITDSQLFRFIELNYHKILELDKEALSHIIIQSSRIKARVVSQDERETKGIRTILNFGHTIGHAIETASDYGKSYTHGEAIAIGMICASEIACRLKICNQKTLCRIESIISMIGLPIHIKNAPLEKIMPAYLHDKKFISGKNRFVLPVNIGKVIIREGISERLIKNVISQRIKK
ncbi:MAG: 3-dehydroquinate synthase [Candidatus Omnitrophica bacterium]|nr:3-dehydroquinate synthase [Candidatus Omnitrophota bacterium]